MNSTASDMKIMRMHQACGEYPGRRVERASLFACVRVEDTLGE